MTSVAVDWGHSLFTPEGREIRVPMFVFPKLRRLGLLQNNRNRLSPAIYEFISPEYDCLCDGLRRLLGSDLSGPSWLVCHCEDCKEKRQIEKHVSEVRSEYLISEIRRR